MSGQGTPGTGSVGVSTPVIVATGGTQNLTIDSGFVKSAAVGDRVWTDTNGNGIQDPGEPGLGGVTVTLTGTDVAGNPITQTVVTGPDGSYLFNVPPGSYTVTFTGGPAGWFPSPVGQGAPGAGSVGGSFTLTLTPGQQVLTVDSGFVPPARVEGTTWVDTNGNGTRDPSEVVLPGVRVTLTDSTGKVVATAITDGKGFYSFPGLYPGTYTVTFTTPDGRTATTAVTATRDVPGGGVAIVDAGFRSAKALPSTGAEGSLNVLIAGMLLLGLGFAASSVSRRRRREA